MEIAPRKMSYSVREYTPADREGCLEVFTSNIPEFFSESEREDFIGFLDRLQGRYGVVVDDSGQIVACGGVANSRTDPHGADLTWGMVHRSLHGRGIGRILTNARMEWIRQMPEVTMGYLNTSHLTEDFYKKYGFVTVKFLENGYRDGLHRCDMEWRRDRV